jgi:hypothetical protein
VTRDPYLIDQGLRSLPIVRAAVAELGWAPTTVRPTICSTNATEHHGGLCGRVTRGHADRRRPPLAVNGPSAISFKTVAAGAPRGQSDRGSDRLRRSPANSGSAFRPLVAVADRVGAEADSYWCCGTARRRACVPRRRVAPQRGRACTQPPHRFGLARLNSTRCATSLLRTGSASIETRLVP